MTVAEIGTRIVLDDRGRAWIEGANTRVLQVVQDKQAHDWTAEEIQAQHPHLGLSQIHAALAYYYAHQTELEAEIQREQADLALLQSRFPTPSRAEQRLRDAASIL